MPAKEIIEQFITRVEENVHDKAIEEFYHTNASMQENNSEPRVGKANLIANEKKILKSVKWMSSKCIRPVFISDDNVIIRWEFTFIWKDDTTTTIEEIAYQNWENNVIIKEKFFYDPIQRIPK
ncbi:polyketide cyclase [Flavobacteriales bacterium 33_180_T64]|nr:polyketide cyclase [Flavobacteriales bacterium 33_180_T64]